MEYPIYAFYGKEHPLSNMYLFEDEGSKTGWWSVEHEFQYDKAEFFGDRVVADKILTTKCPKEAKRLGKKVVPFDKEKWDSVKEEKMYRALKYKLDTCNDFYFKLAEVYYEYYGIAEAAPRDTYWGTGYGKERTLAGESRGRNRLGKLLWRLAHDYIGELGEVSETTIIKKMIAHHPGLPLDDVLDIYNDLKSKIGVYRIDDYLEEV